MLHFRHPHRKLSLADLGSKKTYWGVGPDIPSEKSFLVRVIQYLGTYCKRKHQPLSVIFLGMFTPAMIFPHVP